MSDNMPALPYCCDVVDNILIIMVCEEKIENRARSTVGKGGRKYFYCNTSPRNGKSGLKAFKYFAFKNTAVLAQI